MLKDIFNSVRPEIWLAMGIISLIFIHKEFQRKKKKLPPGPVGLPVVGYLPFLTSLPHLQFTELAKKYGDVFSIYMGSKYVVILNGTKVIREALNKDSFTGRPPNSYISIFSDSPFFTDNMYVWREHRRLALQSMKDLGLGKTKFERLLEEEIRYFLEVLKNANNQPMSLSKPMTNSISNNTCSLVFGERYEYTDLDRTTLDNALEEAIIIAGQTAVHIFIPWLRKIPFASRIWKYEKALKLRKILKDSINGKIQMHKETFDPQDKRDFIDYYLYEMKSKAEKNQQSTFSDDFLETTIASLLGGSDTVHSCTAWCIYIMATYIDIQQKVRQEIHDVIGINSFPQFTQQKDMPYTQAVIREIMRWKTVVPITVLKYTLDDSNVGGYDIPKGAIVITNLHSVHHDKSYWEDPEHFRPERFIDSNGCLLKTDHFMPYSVGKRACPAESMAMMEIFMYFVAVLQKFEVKFPEGFQPTFEAEFGIIYKLKPYKICIKPIN